MGRRNSETELAGKLGASLTAPAPHAYRRRREAEASSVFDLAHPRRPDSAHHRLRSRPGAPSSGTIPIPSLAAPAPPEVKIKPLLVVPVVRPASLYRGSELSGLRPMPVPAHSVGHAVRGGPRHSADPALGVAVAWVATFAIGALAATALPGHVAMRSARGAVVASVPAQSMAARNAGTVTSASARAPSAPADDDNPHAVAPASIGAPEPSALTLEALMRRAVEREPKTRR